MANPRTTSPFSKKHFTEVSNSFPILAQLAQSETAVNKLHVQFIFRYLKSTFTWAMAMATYTGYGDGNSDTGYGDGNSDNLFGIHLELESEGSAPNSKFFPGQDFNGVCFARPMHSTSQFAKTSLSKCVVSIIYSYLSCFCYFSEYHCYYYYHLLLFLILVICATLFMSISSYAFLSFHLGPPQLIHFLVSDTLW